MKKVVLGISLCLIFSISLAIDELAKEKYKSAFSQQVKASFTPILASSGQFGQPGENDFEAKLKEVVSALTVCHMESMAYFSADIQDKTYDIVAKGGSYADAKMFMNSILAAAGAAGGESQAKVQDMAVNSVEYGKQCLQKVSEGLS